tara:strand:+ start:14271 stop:14861 length:591 start_codon:yes stop_codon:yes gene_type:complete
MIIEDIKVYDGPLIHKRFAYDFFRNNTLPIGNIISFRCPMDVNVSGMIDQEDVLQGDYIYSEDAINFCWEIPNLDKFGAVAFQRLLNTQIANILSSKYIKKPIEVDGDDLMVHDEFTGSDNKLQKVGKCSVSITYSKDNVAIGHTGININAGRKAPSFAYSTKLSDDEASKFMQEVIDLFYGMVDDMFIATTKINL